MFLTTHTTDIAGVTKALNLKFFFSKPVNPLRTNNITKLDKLAIDFKLAGNTTKLSELAINFKLEWHRLNFSC